MSLCESLPMQSLCAQWLWWESWIWSKHGEGLFLGHTRAITGTGWSWGLGWARVGAWYGLGLLLRCVGGCCLDEGWGLELHQSQARASSGACWGCSLGRRRLEPGGLELEPGTGQGFSWGMWGLLPWQGLGWSSAGSPSWVWVLTRSLLFPSYSPWCIFFFISLVIDGPFCWSSGHSQRELFYM